MSVSFETTGRGSYGEQVTKAFYILDAPEAPIADLVGERLAALPMGAMALTLCSAAPRGRVL